MPMGWILLLAAGGVCLSIAGVVFLIRIHYLENAIATMQQDMTQLHTVLRSMISQRVNR